MVTKTLKTDNSILKGKKKIYLSYPSSHQLREELNFLFCLFLSLPQDSIPFFAKFSCRNEKLRDWR